MKNNGSKVAFLVFILSLFLFSNAFASMPGKTTAQTTSGTIIASYLDIDPNTKAPHSNGAYKINLNDGSITQIVAEGGKVEAASPDGLHLLVFKPGELLVTDLNGNTLSQVSITFNGDSEFKQAYFSPDSTRAIFIAQDSETPKKGVYSTDLNGTGFLQISKPGTNPFVLFPSFDPNGVYWLKATVDKNNIPRYSSMMYTNLSTKLTKISWAAPTPWLVFSPDKIHAAYLPRMTSVTKNILNISELDGKNKIDLIGPRSPDKEMRDIYLTGKYWAYPLAWSPDGSQLLVHVYKQMTASDEYYVFDVKGNVISRRLPLSWSTAWSPDGTQIAFFSNGLLSIFDLVSNNVVRTFNLANGLNVTLYWMANY
jgi:Tol biopolymer transport system component